MARPHKTGIDYFSLDVDFFDDPKIIAIAVEFGIKGEIIALRLLCAIYRNGYFIKWDDPLKMKIAKSTGLSPELIDHVVERLTKWDFFDKDLFEKSNLLTSRGIQKRYCESTSRRSNSEIVNFCLLKFDDFPVNVDNNRVNVDNNRVNVDNNRVNVYKSTQSKVKESKVKKETIKKEEIPFEKIIAIYHEILPQLPRALYLSDTRKSHITARWSELNTLDKWREYFNQVKSQPLLLGNNDKQWLASFDWLINLTNFIKVRENRYATTWNRNRKSPPESTGKFSAAEHTNAV